mgnify:FL=1
MEEDGFEVTYDFTIGDGHLFSANGILTHTTETEAVRSMVSLYFDAEGLAYGQSNTSLARWVIDDGAIDQYVLGTVSF